ncbi:MAG: hypothetical protein ACRDID_08240 [Ktedonobacterales bacterium]
MRHPKRAWLIAGSGLAVFAMIAGAMFVHANSASAATADSTPITYIAKPPMKLLGTSAQAKTNFLTPSYCIANFGLACYTPAEIRKAYNIPDSATGAGQTIVIVDAYGSPTIRSDLQLFDQVFGLQDPTLNIYYPTGHDTNSKGHKDVAASWVGETSLDVEWAHAIAPDATIDLVIASNAGGNVLNVAQRYAI